MTPHTDPVPDNTARPQAPDDIAADLIARCPEHGTRTDTWPECRCAAARKAAAWLAAEQQPAPTAYDDADREQQEQDEKQAGLAHAAGEHAMCGPECQGATIARWAAEAAAEVAHIEDDAAREEQQDKAITARAHKAGNHQWCDVTCEAAMPSEVLRNTILCRAIPGSKGALAELERRAAASGHAQAAEEQRLADEDLERYPEEANRPAAGTCDALPPTLAALTTLIAADPGAMTTAEAEASARTLLAGHTRELADLVHDELRADRERNPGGGRMTWRNHARRGGMMTARTVLDRYADQLDQTAGGEQV